MFAQVACLVCGKPFQVPKDRLGNTVTCSWCNAPTEAVPLAVDVQPLPPVEPAPQVDVRRARRLGWPVYLAYAGLLVLVAGGVYGGMRWFRRSVEQLREFTAPDGSCKVLLPGIPVEQSVPEGEFLKSGKQFVSEPAWGERLRGEVGWYDIPDARLARADDLFGLLRDQRAGELKLVASSEAAVRVDSRYGREVRFVNGDVAYVERYLFDERSDRPRMYWVSVGGAKFDPDSATAAKVVGSLRVMK